MLQASFVQNGLFSYKPEIERILAPAGASVLIISWSFGRFVSSQIFLQPNFQDPVYSAESVKARASALNRSFGQFDQCFGRFTWLIG